ncbi:GNAT family N-acetyltransferase [Tenacibaculum soleae]|uniref:GNAT family N-acetyltransferase n=1 Tax=Tenacibaculum soleae TaxID=447689 RepID=UPI0023012D36|nr:GNAT family N-acetyltransferase [Tenacibaculum soleae]
MSNTKGLYIIKLLEKNDLKSVVEIYNTHVHSSFSAFSEEKFQISDFQKMINDGLPCFVVIDKKLDIIGFGLIYKYRKEKTFDKSVKFTYFLTNSVTGKGIGSKLYNIMELQCISLGINNILVNISSENLGSINFHKKKGFMECGRFKNIGMKFGKHFDMVWMLKKLEKPIV